MLFQFSHQWLTKEIQNQVQGLTSYLVGSGYFRECLRYRDGNWGQELC